jgi:hypothetical protein
MKITARHQEVEAGFRRLVEDYELTPPDRVVYEPEAVVFVWDESKLAVVVDFDGPDDDMRSSLFRDLRPGAPLN